DRRSASFSDLGWYSYANGGFLDLFVSSHPPQQMVEICVKGRGSTDFSQLATEVMEWVYSAKIEAEVTDVTTVDDMLSFSYRLPPTVDASLVTLVEYDGEFFTNVRVDDRELRYGSRAELNVSGRDLRPGADITASWTGIQSPAIDDWIGLFPVGAPSESRV